MSRFWVHGTLAWMSLVLTFGAQEEPTPEEPAVQEAPAPQPSPVVQEEVPPAEEQAAPTTSRAEKTPTEMTTNEPATEDPAVPGVADPVAPEESTPNQATGPPDGAALAEVIAPPVAAGSLELPFLSAAELAEQMRALCARFPESARLLEVGRSAGGREILGLELGGSSPDGLDAGPALGWFEYRSGSHRGGEGALAVARWLLEGAASQPRVAEVLGRGRLVLLPGLDPDGRDQDPVSGGVHYGRNFPLGWEPPARGPSGGGSYPLSLPETLALVQFLEGHRDLAMVLTTSGDSGPGGRYPGAEFPRPDQLLLERVAEGEPPLLPWPRFALSGGGPFDFAYQAHGILPLAFADPPLQDPGSWRDAASLRVLDLLESLPRLTLEEVARVRIGPGLWQLDVAVVNIAGLPTLSALAAARGRRGRVVLEITGGRLVATARREAGEAAFTNGDMPGPRGGAIDVAERLAPQERVELRLFVEAPAGSRVLLRAHSERAAGVRRELVMNE